MIASMTSDLEKHLHEIDNRLRILTLERAKSWGEDAAERERIQEERIRIKQCLSICAQVSEHVDEVQPNASEDVSVAQVTANVLQEYKEILATTTSDLEEHLQE